MKVIVVFEFDDIDDPNGADANLVVDAITQDCETMRVAFDASGCYVHECVGEMK